MIKTSSILLLFLLIFSGVNAQQNIFNVNFDDVPLNKALVQLSDEYGLQLSFNDKALSRYLITVNQHFSNIDEMFIALLQGLPLDIDRSGDVYIIVPRKQQESIPEKPKLHSISGQVIEKDTREVLPYTHITINNKQLVSGLNGDFHFTASGDSVFQLKVSHIGYYILDTLLRAGSSSQIVLTPAFENLPEILVQDNMVASAALVGGQPGNMKLNHNIARFLPGHGDNSVFNMLRLMPGVQAANEQSDDLLLWGSYEGQSQITFDGYTVFGIKNYSDNISVVNPFVVKNIDVFKGGYDARFGNRVGGIVNITGKNGTLQKPTLSFNINNTTLNGMLEVPLFERSSLLVAYRRTFYNLYSAADFNIFAPTRPAAGNARSANVRRNTITDLEVFPNDYFFNDLNLKYSLNLKNGNVFYISAYAGGDNFNLAAEADILWKPRPQDRVGRVFEIPYDVVFNSNEKYRQYGFSTFYSMKWTPNLQSQIILSHAGFSKSTDENLELINSDTGEINNRKTNFEDNRITEKSIRIENRVDFKNAHQLDFGGGYYHNRAELMRNFNIQETTELSLFKNSRYFLYANDVLPIGNSFTLKSGARLSLANGNIFIEPRLSAAYKISGNIKTHFSWGIYKQFAYKLATVDVDENFIYSWVAAEDAIPELHAEHRVLGVNFYRPELSVNVDAYYKTTDNLIRTVHVQQQTGNNITSRIEQILGNARAYGIDAFVKKDFGFHSVWASYSLSKVKEQLFTSALRGNMYEPAPHDQRHEFKIAALYKLGSFYFTGNYIFGSGMQMLKELFPDEQKSIRYNRFDVALSYKFPGTFNGETGISILNLFDASNLKYSNIKNINVAQNVGSVKIYTGAVPFTPLIFIKMTF